MVDDDTRRVSRSVVRRFSLGAPLRESLRGVRLKERRHELLHTRVGQRFLRLMLPTCLARTDRARPSRTYTWPRGMGAVNRRDHALQYVTGQHCYYGAYRMRCTATLSPAPRG